jgi:hypothetical protein
VCAEGRIEVEVREQIQKMVASKIGEFFFLEEGKKSWKQRKIEKCCLRLSKSLIDKGFSLCEFVELRFISQLGLKFIDQQDHVLAIKIMVSHSPEDSASGSGAMYKA